MDVYIDLYYLVNASMDLLCLTMSAAILHRPVRRWRLMLAALFGGGYAVVMLLWGPDGAAGVALDLAAAVLLAAIALFRRGQRLRRLFQSAAVYALLSAVLGGLMTVLYSFLNRLHLPLESLQGDGLSAWMFALLAAVAGIFTLRSGKLFRRAAVTKDVFLEVTVEGRSIRLHALVDSGNLLRDPLGGRSVVVADPAKLKPVLPPGLRDALEHPTETSAEPYARRIRLIPAKSATGECLLAAFLPDRLVLCNGRERVEADDLIALSPLGESAKGYDALISLE